MFTLGLTLISSLFAGAASSLPAEDPIGLLELIISGFRTGQTAPAVAALLTLVVWLTRRFALPKLPASALPWVAMASGVVAEVGSMLLVEKTWWVAVIRGLVVGAAAAGLWSAVFKHFLAPPTPTPAPLELPKS